MTSSSGSHSLQLQTWGIYRYSSVYNWNVESVTVLADTTKKGRPEAAPHELRSENQISSLSHNMLPWQVMVSRSIWATSEEG